MSKVLMLIGLAITNIYFICWSKRFYLLFIYNSHEDIYWVNYYNSKQSNNARFFYNIWVLMEVFICKKHWLRLLYYESSTYLQRKQIWKIVYYIFCQNIL
jgi:hypothetical protein